jgi:hypothetical protein
MRDRIGLDPIAAPLRFQGFEHREQIDGQAGIDDRGLQTATSRSARILRSPAFALPQKGDDGSADATRYRISEYPQDQQSLDRRSKSI